MKKYLFFTGIVAGLFAISSCNKVNNVPDSVIEVPDGMYLFTLEASSIPETKTYYTGDGGSIASDKVFNWSAGDQISVLFHKGTENEFFTLTNQTGDGTSATFKGLILDGYTIGASDTETKWALFPASDGHSYTPGVADPATDPVVMFNIPAETDFSASHFSANIPMAAKGDGSNHFVFNHLASAYKFTFTGLDVSKVRLTVENQESYFLSGNNPLNAAGSAIAYNYAFSRNANHSISFVENVVGKKATFYVPFKTWEGQFTPILTLYDAETGYTIKTLTATSAFSGDLGTQYNRVIIVPDISAPGTGVAPFVPLIDIDGDMSDWNPASNTRLTSSNIKTASKGSSTFKELRVAYDEKYVYVYIKRNRVYTLWGVNQAYYYMFFDTDNDSSNGIEKSGYNYEYGLYLYPFAGTKGDSELTAVPGFVDSGSTNLASGGFSLGGSIPFLNAGTYDSDNVEIELRMLRSDLAIDKNDVINIAAYGNKSADGTPYTRIADFTIVN
ncbi:MAG: hypothetical protein IJR12_05565 [Bacteroidales bacterium]|nr:hypothetical protein [Bacteroidales bacterium]